MPTYENNIVGQDENGPSPRFIGGCNKTWLRDLLAEHLILPNLKVVESSFASSLLLWAEFKTEIGSIVALPHHIKDAAS